MSLYVAICKKCGKPYDMMGCPYCNLKKIKISQKRENEKRRNN